MSSPGRGPGHETRDVNILRITILTGALVVVIAVALGLMLVTFNYFAAREARHQPAPSTLAGRPANQLPPEPRLQANPVKDLAQMRAEEDALLSSYGWVDRKSGIVRIPVDRAMELTVQRGLPVRAALPALPALPNAAPAKEGGKEARP